MNISFDRELYDKIEYLIDEGQFASVSHCCKRAIREWMKRHYGSHFLYSPLSQIIEEDSQKSHEK